MRLQHLVLLGLVSLLTLGCNKQVSGNQASTNTSDRSAPSPIVETTPSTQSTTIKSGVFVPGEQPTEGTARIVTKNGKPYLELDQEFKTSEQGPDLVVILHRSDNIIGSTKPPAYPLKKGDYVVLAPLKKFSGAQSYAIPETISLNDYKSAGIWCRKFNATFGAAKFTSAQTPKSSNPG
jgi:hypothetical protein